MRFCWSLSQKSGWTETGHGRIWSLLLSRSFSTPSQFRSRQLTGPNFLIWEGKLWKDGLKTLTIYSVRVHTCNLRTLEAGPELLSEAFSNKPATMQNPEPKLF